MGHDPDSNQALKQGVKDMVRISDSRMSGTSFGTVVLHISPESAVGGPLAAVKTGDLVRLDVPGRQLDLLVSQRDLKQRLAQWEPKGRHFRRGYYTLFLNHVLQAHEGCDFDFLRGDPGETPYEPVIRKIMIPTVSNSLGDIFNCPLGKETDDCPSTRVFVIARIKLSEACRSLLRFRSL